MSYNPVNKRVIYVGGLAENVDEKILHAAFIPFGDIVTCNMPMDFETETNRGFGFVEFEHMHSMDIWKKSVRKPKIGFRSMNL